MKCTTAITMAIAQLKASGQQVSYGNLEKATQLIRGRAVSMRQMLRSPNRELIEAARGPLPGLRQGRRAKAAKKLDEADRLRIKVAELEERVAFLVAGHHDRRRRG